MSTDAAQAPADGARAQEPTQDEVYDQAFEKFLGPESDNQTDTQSATPTEPATEPAQDDNQASQAPELTDEQTELLSRSHMTPEMIAGWTPQQREDFFANAAKRESDQRSYSREKGDEVAELRRRLDELEGKGKAGGTDDQGEQAGADGGTPDLGKLGETFKSVISDLNDTFGDDFQALEAPIMGIVEQAEKTQAKLADTERALTIQNRVIVDMVIDKGIDGLVADYPSLSEDKPRAEVEAKFAELWQADRSPYRTGEGPLLARVRRGIKAAADATLGKNTEAAAQAALLDKTKQRLDQQPGDGKGRTEDRPLTEDEMYDKAFDEYLGKK